MALDKVEQEGGGLSASGTDRPGRDRWVHLDSSLNGRAEPPAKAAKLSSTLEPTGRTHANTHTCYD